MVGIVCRWKSHPLHVGLAGGVLTGLRTDGGGGRGSGRGTGLHLTDDP